MRTSPRWLGGFVWIAVIAALACLASPAPAARKGDPGGNEAIRLPVPPPGGKLFGFHEEAWQYANPAFTAAEAAAAAELAGANALRYEIDWNTAEPQRDRWNEFVWSRAQAMYDALTQRQMTPVIFIGFAPAWARDGGYPQVCGSARGCEYPPARGMLDEWAEFCAEVARRFPLAAIEVWNEPNLVNFWKPAPDPERYAELLNVAYDAIKGTSSRTVVLGGSLASATKAQFGAGGNPTVMTMRGFLDRAYAATPSIAGHMDAISFHMVFQQVYMGGGSVFADAFSSARESSAAHGERKRRFWITEAGLSTTGKDAMSEAEQAEGLLRQYRRLLTMPDVDAYLIHTLQERYEVPADDENRGHGAVLSVDPLVPKRSFCEFANRNGTPIAQTGCAPGVSEPFPRLWKTAKRCTSKLVGLRSKILKSRGRGRERAAGRYRRRLGDCAKGEPGRRCIRRLEKLERQILNGAPELELVRVEAHEKQVRNC